MLVEGFSLSAAGLVQYARCRLKPSTIASKPNLRGCLKTVHRTRFRPILEVWLHEQKEKVLNTTPNRV
jgi:hypothetical protein